VTRSAASRFPVAVALKKDPFTPNAPIDDPARFSGRDTELEAIIDALYQTAQRNPHHVAITGARGIGKTSALHMAAKVAQGDRELIDRLAIDTGDFEFKMLPVVQRQLVVRPLRPWRRRCSIDFDAHLKRGGSRRRRSIGSWTSGSSR